MGAFSVADLALVSLVLKLPGALRPSGLGLPRLSRWEAASLARPGVSSAMAAPRAPLIESGNAPIVRQSSSTRA